MKLNYSQKMLVISTVIFVGVLVLNIIFINLLLNLVTGFNDKTQQLDNSFQVLQKETKLKDVIANSKEAGEKLSLYFVGPGDVETVNFVKFLEDLAVKNNVIQEKSLAYEPVAELPNSNTVSAIRFRSNISGSFANVFSFLQAIENMPKVVSLKSASLNTVDKGWAMSLDFSVIKLK